MGKSDNRVQDQIMKPEHRKYALAEVPRYTSYPTAVQFEPGTGERQYRTWLEQIAPGAPLSLYVHIPFCKQMCWYCGCHTSVAHTYERVGAYAQDLLAEIALLAAAVPDHHGGLAHVHFGGGSPTLLSDADFAAITGTIVSAFGARSGMELAVEIDPRTMSAQKAAALAAAGVTRASLGVQDFNAHVQRKINRIQPFAMVRDAVHWLRDAGIAAINFDLIYGLPGQSVADVRRSAQKALSLRPDRLAVFGYAHVPWFKKHQQMIAQADLPGMEERFAQAATVGEVLRAGGYEAIGFDHYAHPQDSMAMAAREGRLRRNFQGYTTDTADTLLGLGASSISALEQGYVQNAPALDGWRKAIHEGRLPVVRGVALRGEDALRRAAIMTLMSAMELDCAALCARHGMPAETLDDALDKLRPLQQDGLVTRDGRTVHVTPEGRIFVRNIAACFDAYWQDSAGRHSRAV